MPLQEETIKLFRVPVRCYAMSNLDLHTGTYKDPYFKTDLGLAFAGDCFQAQSIVNAFLRAVSQLVVVGDGQPRPSATGLVRLLREIAQNWLSTYRLAVPDIQLLLFGYSPQNSLPWAARLKWPQVIGPNGDQFEEPLRDTSVFIIGAEAKPEGIAYAAELRDLFMKKTGKLNLAELRKAGFEPDLEAAKLLNADRMLIEDDVASLLMAHAHTTIGGVMQKVEVIPVGGETCTVAFSTDDAAHLGALSDVEPGLAYRSVHWQVGTKGRPSPFGEDKALAS